MQGKRLDRVNQLIKEEISTLLQRELKDPRLGFVTVTEVETAKDLRVAKVFVSVLGDERQWASSLAALTSARGFVRNWLRQHLDLRVTPDARLPGRPLDGARGQDPVAPQAGPGRPVSGTVGPAPPDVLAALRRPPGRALMLGHVHPDADVLGTLMALGLALEARGWQVVYGGPHPAPGALGFLPGIERYRVLPAIDGRFDVAVLTDCPNPGRTEGLIDQARAAASVVVNIDHHPDNRRYGHVNWIDTDRRRHR